MIVFFIMALYGAYFEVVIKRLVDSLCKCGVYESVLLNIQMRYCCTVIFTWHMFVFQAQDLHFNRGSELRDGYSYLLY